MQSETPFANDDWRCKKMSEIENDAAEDVSYEDNEKHVVRRRANGRATRLKILAAARAIIIEKGTDSLSIDRVIKEAGVSKGSFMYHFPSRQALIEALVNEYAAHLGEVQTGLTNKAKSDCPMLEAYAEWYKGFTSGEIDSGSSPLVALAMASRENRKFMEPVRDWYRRYFDRVKQEACGSERALVYTLAYDALFFHHLFGTDVLTDDEKKAVTRTLQAFADGGVNKQEALGRVFWKRKSRPTLRHLIGRGIPRETQMNLCQVAAVMRAARANATGKTESH